VLIALFACFAHPKAIFYRKHLLAPMLKFAAVLSLVLLRADVKFLAHGYLIASTFGVALYVGILLRLLRRDGTLEGMRAAPLRIPAKELFGFSIPLLTSNLVAIVMHSADTMILGYFHPSTEVAMYRVILPAASLNTIVMASFGLLYLPLAARLFARNDFQGIRTMYWSTTVWMAVFSFPVFAITFGLAKSLTITLYGERYADSAILLQLFAAAYYFGVALGNNGLTLKVLGKIRYIVLVNVSAMLAALVLAVLLVPRFGALGAAVATATSMVLHNILKQVGLRVALGKHFFEWRVVPVYAVITGCVLTLLVVQLLVSPSLLLGVPLAVALSLLVLLLSRRMLDVEDTFPELLRLPLVGSLLRSDRSRRSS
jgi:O-antigen/teichoic acid export membrane protein